MNVMDEEVRREKQRILNEELECIIAGPKPVLRRLVVPKQFKPCESMWKRYGDFFPYVEPGTALVVHVGCKRALRLFVWENFALPHPWIVRIAQHANYIMTCCVSSTPGSHQKGIDETAELNVWNMFGIRPGGTTVKCLKVFWPNTEDAVSKPISGKLLPVLIPLTKTRGRIKDPLNLIITHKEPPNATSSPNPSSDGPPDPSPSVCMGIPEREGCDCILCRTQRAFNGGRDVVDSIHWVGDTIQIGNQIIGRIIHPNNWIETGGDPAQHSGNATPNPQGEPECPVTLGPLATVS